MIKDFDIIKLPVCIGRVFAGPIPSGKLPFLVRYLLVNGSWEKVAPYATEKGLIDFEGLGCGRAYIAEAGQYLPTVPIHALPPVIDPLSWSISDTISSSTRSLMHRILPGAPSSAAAIGLVGSRIVGLEKENSDIDLVISNDRRDLLEHFIRNFGVCDIDDLIRISKKFQKFTEVSNIHERSEGELLSRNEQVFKSAGTIIDLHFSRNRVFKESFVRDRRQVDKINVIDDRHRNEYPLSFSFEMNGKEVDLYSLDASLHFVRNGDSLIAPEIEFSNEINSGHGFIHSFEKIVLR